MSLISKPVDWEVFNISPIQTVQYYSILKKQREFSQLIKQYDSQVFRHGYLHYCGIVPKYLSSSLYNRYEIVIVFLNGISTNSFIGFRVKVSKETFTNESRSLLVFLKKSEKAAFYSMNNNRIHVQCQTNAWELFYLLYDDFLRNYVLTIIGTQFFYHFVYSCCIEKEKQFLKLMSKGSKVIKVSKSSIYYKVHRKRKISVTDLIHMTLNMPKRRKYTIPSCDIKKSMLYSDVELRDFYTVGGRKVNISKLTLKRYKRQDTVPEKCTEKLTLTDVSHKRKYDEINASDNLEPSTLSKYLKTSKSDSVDMVEWKQYQNLKVFNLNNYSSISFINAIVPSLLKQENVLSCDSNLHSRKDSLLPLSPERREIEIFTTLQKPCTLKHKKNVSETSDIEKTLNGNKSGKDFASHHSLFRNNHENISSTNDSNSTGNCDINSFHFSTNMKDDDCLAAENANFTTATGRVINVSPAAMLKAYKLCEKEEIVPKNIACDMKQIVPEKIPYVDSQKKSITKECLPKKTFLPESKKSFIKSDENIPKKLVSIHSSSIESLNPDNFEITEDVTFSTATGKKINVSNVAMEAAHKLIYNTSSEKRSTNNESLPIHKKQFYKDKVDHACTSKADDVDMDNTLVEKFFEDVQFDDKELELTESNIGKDNSKVTYEAKSEKCQSRKPRKSLGGRRSMRFSDKL